MDRRIPLVPKEKSQRFSFIDGRSEAVLWGAAFFHAAGGNLPEKRPSEGQDENAAASYRRAAPYLDASWQLIGSVALWTAAGWFGDKKLHTTPWLLVAGAVIGTALGFYLFFKSVMAIGRKQ